jgi:hypothetical protein
VTKPLDPEIKAMGAMLRALQPLDAEQQKRSCEWIVAKLSGNSSVFLPAFIKRPKDDA